MVLDRLKEAGIEAAKGIFIDHPLFEHVRGNPQSKSRLEQIVSDYSGWHFGNQQHVRPLDPPPIRRLHEIVVPTLIIVGERDMADFHNIAGILERDTPRSQKVIIPDVGHIPNMEDPERFNEIVLDFLEEV